MKLLKNQKPSTKQSSILLSILTGNESKDKVIKKLKEYDKIIISFVMDSTNNVNTTSAGTKIKEAENVIYDLKRKLRGKVVKENMVWGNTLQKTINSAKLEKIKNIMLVDTQRMRKDLEENKFNVIVVKT